MIEYTINNQRVTREEWLHSSANGIYRKFNNGRCGVEIPYVNDKARMDLLEEENKFLRLVLFGCL